MSWWVTSGSVVKTTPDLRKRGVETSGLEPPTPCLQSRCSSQLSYVPVDCASDLGFLLLTPS